jgi:hypothetical protein
MSELDLDINNYDLSNLETFFRLPTQYNEHDIAQNESDIRAVLLSSGHIPAHFKRDLIVFLDEGKKRLIAAKIKIRHPTTIKSPIDDSLAIPHNFPIPNISPPSRAENIILPKETPFVYTQASEFFRGTLNPLDHRTLHKCISIDSRFRPASTSNSDFTIHLPSRIQKVLSVECASFEIDRSSLYNISSSLGNNYIYISICAVEQEYNQIFIIPDGHYDLDLLIVTLNRLLESQEHTPFLYIHFKKDPFGSGKCILMINQDSEHDYITQRINYLSLDFTIDNAGNADKFHDSFSKMGYLLGLTKQKYSGQTQYMGEIPVRMHAALPYFYLYIDDFQNRSAACFQPAFSQITMSPSILARISLKEKESVEILSTPRKYFGPIDMSRLQIRLLDPYGKVLQMDANFSFCLLLHTVYDI